MSNGALNPTNTPDTFVRPVINSTAISQPLYVCASGHAKVTINRQLKTTALLDNGSEVNMMTKKLFDGLNLINKDIRWRINVYDTKTNENLDTARPIGVCHDVPIDVGEVSGSQAIFIVEYATMTCSWADPGNG